MLLLDAYYFKNLPVLLESDTGKTIYRKFMNIADENLEPMMLLLKHTVRISCVLTNV